ncbi:hypothetical protein [Bartonella sp. B1098]|uniref:hypothetical protein n=1 Tax=Bartonella sp. B1098 TaxID=2911421 RepID=UPI0020C34A57|nr:hypothetical protein [Bartonella sp. B1098]
MPIGKVENICGSGFVGPYSHASRIVRDMQRHAFPHQHHCYAVRRNADGGIRKITQLAFTHQVRKSFKPYSLKEETLKKLFEQ